MIPNLKSGNKSTDLECDVQFFNFEQQIKKNNDRYVNVRGARYYFQQPLLFLLHFHCPSGNRFAFTLSKRLRGECQHSHIKKLYSDSNAFWKFPLMLRTHTSIQLTILNKNNEKLYQTWKAYQHINESKYVIGK